MRIGFDRMSHVSRIPSEDEAQRWSPFWAVATVVAGIGTLMTLEVLRARGVTVAGVAFVGEEEPVAQMAIARLGGAPLLGRLPLLDPLNADTLAIAFAANLDVGKLA